MLRADPKAGEMVPRLEEAVRSGSMLPSLAAKEVLSSFTKRNAE
jgi:hypothetical protein